MTASRSAQDIDDDMPSATPGWMKRLAHGRLGMGVLSALEASVVPIPLEAIMVPVMLAWPRRAWMLALISVIGAMLGASAMYFLGLLAFEVLQGAAGGMLDVDAAQEFVEELDGSGAFWAIFAVALGPLPMQMATLGAGAAKVSFPVFLAAITASRGLRYFALALACRVLGERVQHLPRRWLVVGSMAVLLLAWGGYRLLT